VKRGISWLTQQRWSWLELWVIATAWEIAAHYAWAAQAGIIAGATIGALVLTDLLRYFAKLPENQRGTRKHST